MQGATGGVDRGMLINVIEINQGKFPLQSI